MQVDAEAKVARIEIDRKHTPISVKQNSLISRNIVFRKSAGADWSLEGSRHKILIM